MNERMLRRDCARCAALCCVSLAFDRSELFAVDKAAGVACPQLTSSHRCGIHPELERRGFSGCARYDCLGAGQRVTQDLFAGRSWQKDPRLAEPMFDAFRVMRQVHELLLLLQTAGRLPLPTPHAERRSELESLLQPARGWTPESLTAFERSDVPRQIEAFFWELRQLVSPERRLRRRLPLTS